MKANLPDSRNPKVVSETRDAFDSVEIIVKAKIERLCNDGKYDEASALEAALNLIGETDYSV